MNDLKFLVVEDEATSALIMKILFESMGCDIGKIAATGEEAVSRGLSEKPDVVCMDIQLAGKMDGIEAAEKIVAANPETKVIFLTAYSDELTVSRAKKLNPAAYILKPFDLGELKKTIEAICAAA